MNGGCEAIKWIEKKWHFFYSLSLSSEWVNNVDKHEPFRRAS